jgi:uncharacterized protein YgbK (DUF1537 family)
MPAFAPNPPRISAASSASLPERIYILADDLTGACDSAAAFVAVGRAVRVWLGATAAFPAAEPVQAFHTDSRSLPPAEAARVVSRAAKELAALPNALWFKKIDSAARGPFAAEILAAHRAFGSRAVLLAPAFPAAGRTVRNGILEIRDAAGQRTKIDVAGLFPPRTRGLMHRVGSAQELAAAYNTGKPVLLCDSLTQADLEALVRNAENLPGLLFAGSAGLAQALARRARRRRRRVPPPTASRVLIVAGSEHPLTKLQLATLDPAHACAVEVLRPRFSGRDGARIRKAFRSLAPQALILTGGDTAMLTASALGAHSFILQGELAPGVPWGMVQGGVADGSIAITKSGGFGAPTIFNEILATLRGQA